MNTDNELSRVLVLERQVADLRTDYEGACKTIAQMHVAAMGEIRGPRRGVVADVEDLRVERDMLIQRIMDSKPPALQAKLDAAEAERDRLQKIVHAVDDVLMVNWIAVPPGGDYKKALHDFFKAERKKAPLAEGLEALQPPKGIEDPITASGICEPDPSGSG